MRASLLLVLLSASYLGLMGCGEDLGETDRSDDGGTDASRDSTSADGASDGAADGSRDTNTVDSSESDSGTDARPDTGDSATGDSATGDSGTGGGTLRGHLNDIRRVEGGTIDPIALDNRYYAYGGSYIREGGDIHGFFCASGAPYVEGDHPDWTPNAEYEADVIVHAKSSDGVQWRDARVVIESSGSTGSRDLNKAACTNGVTRVGDHIYMVFESYNEDAAGLLSVYLARASALDGDFRVWTGESSWGAPSTSDWEPIVMPHLWTAERARAERWQDGACFPTSTRPDGSCPGTEVGTQCCMDCDPDELPYSNVGNPFWGCGVPRIAPTLDGEGLMLLYTDTTVYSTRLAGQPPELPIDGLPQVRQRRIDFDGDRPNVSSPQDASTPMNRWVPSGSQLLQNAGEYVNIGVENGEMYRRTSPDGANWSDGERIATIQEVPGLAHPQRGEFTSFVVNQRAQYPHAAEVEFFVSHARPHRKWVAGGHGRMDLVTPGTVLRGTNTRAVSLFRATVSEAGSPDSVPLPSLGPLTLTPDTPIVHFIEVSGGSVRVCGQGFRHEGELSVYAEWRWVSPSEGFRRNPAFTGDPEVLFLTPDNGLLTTGSHPKFGDCITTTVLAGFESLLSTDGWRAMFDVVRVGGGRARVEVNPVERVSSGSWNAEAPVSRYYSPLNIHAVTNPDDRGSSTRVRVCGTHLWPNLFGAGHWVDLNVGGSRFGSWWYYFLQSGADRGYEVSVSIDSRTRRRCADFDVPHVDFRLSETGRGTGSLELEIGQAVRGVDETAARVLIDGDHAW